MKTRFYTLHMMHLNKMNVDFDLDVARIFTNPLAVGRLDPVTFARPHVNIERAIGIYMGYKRMLERDLELALQLAVSTRTYRELPPSGMIIVESSGPPDGFVEDTHDIVRSVQTTVQRIRRALLKCNQWLDHHRPQVAQIQADMLDTKIDNPMFGIDRSVGQIVASYL